MNTKKWLIGIISVGLLLSSMAYASPRGINPGLHTLTLEIDGLNPLEQGHYEGWIIIDGEKISTGKFRAGSELIFHTEQDLRRVEKVVVTIEPEGDNDDIPSGIVLLEGIVRENMVNLHFPVNFSGASGTYILATPTNGPDTNETSGIWFLDLTDKGPVAGLDVPGLPTGWIYEGWVVQDGVPLTTGRFFTPNGFDLFDGFSGPEPGPPFPGEDFLNNAPNGVTFPLDLAAGGTLVVLTVEPDLNGVDPTGEAPFFVKPLVGGVPAGLVDQTPTPLVKQPPIITGTAYLEE